MNLKTVPNAAENKKILVMDDDKAISEIACEMLRRQGYQVAHTQDGTEALLLADKAARQGGPFEAALLDLTVPGGMGGAETLLRLRENGHNFPAVIATGYADDSIVANPQSAGFAGAVPKPYRERDLARAIADALEGNNSGDHSGEQQKRGI